MPISNPSFIQAAVPENKMDQIIDIITGSFSIANGTTDAFNVVTPAHSNPTVAVPAVDYYQIKGLWTADGGNSWQEIGSSIINGDYANGLRTLTLTIHSDVTSATNTALITINATNYGASGYTIQYKLLLIARVDQDGVQIGPLNQVLAYRSNQNYMKIFADSFVDLPSSGNTPIPHNLGVVPNVNLWEKAVFIGSTPDIEMFPASSFSVDTQNLILTDNSSPGFITIRAYYRIYLDA